MGQHSSSKRAVSIGHWCGIKAIARAITQPNTECWHTIYAQTATAGLKFNKHFPTASFIAIAKGRIITASFKDYII